MPREKGELELSFQLKALVNPCLAEYRAYKTEQQHCTPCYLAGLALLMKFSCFHNAILHPLWGQIKGIKWMLQRCAWRKGLDNGIAFIFTAFFSAWCSRRSKLWARARPSISYPTISYCQSSKSNSHKDVLSRLKIEIFFRKFLILLREEGSGRIWSDWKVVSRDFQGTCVRNYPQTWTKTPITAFFIISTGCVPKGLSLWIHAMQSLNIGFTNRLVGAKDF